jgi:streptogrisin C
MTPPSRIRRLGVGLGVATTAAALVLGSTASANARPDDARLQETPARASAAVAAHDRLADRLGSRLGDRATGGAYVDKSGDLVVTVTTAAAARQVRASGAESRRVDDSSARLERVHQRLDRFSRRAGAGAVQGWYVDVPDNSVVVSAAEGAHNKATRKFLDKARSFGDTVRIERTAADATPAAYLYGGQQVAMSNGYVCSNGFNARLSSGAYVMLTAGHCAEGYQTFSRNGVTIGGTRGYSFPGNDYASVNINDPSYWNPQAAVDMYNGYARPVVGYSSAPVGSSLCKSGRTTGWTCGVIQAYNQTVNYGGGDIVYGLVRHSACVEQGDSGGSNLTGNYAQGLSSGGALYQQGNRLVCGQKVGQPNVSYYQPVGEALSAYGATLLTQ